MPSLRPWRHNPHDFAEDMLGLKAERLSNARQLQNINAPLPGFISRDERLWFPQALGHILLLEPGTLPQASEGAANDLMLLRGNPHALRSDRRAGGLSKSENRISKIPIFS